MGCSLSKHATKLVAILAIAPCASCWAQNGIQNIVVTSAASFQIGLPARGSIGTIFCTGLSVQGVTAAKAVPLPFTLAGITVTVGGAPAPLFAVAALTGYQQINFEVPQEAQIGSDGSAQIIVQQNGVQGSAVVRMPSAPGDFFLIPVTQYGIFQHGADFSLVTKDQPAKPGEILVGYLTGLPGTSPIVPTGQPSPFQPLATVSQIDTFQLVNVFNIVINGSITVSNQTVPGSIPFLGLSPGSVGLYQINFVLPGNIGPGDAQIKLEQVVCQPIFGQCGTPPSTGHTYDSVPVLLPVG